MAVAKHKLIRNLTHVTLRLRFGSRRDPFHVELKPRGIFGDVATIPVEFVSHPDFAREQGRSFEVITATIANSIEYAEAIAFRPKIADEIKFMGIERQSDSEVTVARFEVDERGREKIVERSPNGMRKNRATEMEPPHAKVAGSVDGPDVEAVRKPRRNKAENEQTDLPVFKGTTRVKT